MAGGRGRGGGPSIDPALARACAALQPWEGLERSAAMAAFYAALAGETAVILDAWFALRPASLPAMALSGVLGCLAPPAVSMRLLPTPSVPVLWRPWPATRRYSTPFGGEGL